MKEKLGVVRIDEVQQTFFVRDRLDPDRVKFFAALYRSGGNVPPIEITNQSFELIDGRHRVAGADCAGKEELPCIFRPNAPRAELIVLAIKANCGGPLPLSESDIILNMKNMLGGGLTDEKVMDRLRGVFPEVLLREYLKRARQERRSDAVAKAAVAVTNRTMSVAEASKEFRVSPELIKGHMKGERVKRAPSRDPKRLLSNQFRVHTKRTTGQLRSAIEQFESGTLKAAVVKELFGHVEHLLQESHKTYTDLYQRFMDRARSRGVAKE